MSALTRLGSIRSETELSFCFVDLASFTLFARILVIRHLDCQTRKSLGQTDRSILAMTLQYSSSSFSSVTPSHCQSKYSITTFHALRLLVFLLTLFRSRSDRPRAKRVTNDYRSELRSPGRSRETERELTKHKFVRHRRSRTGYPSRCYPRQLYERSISSTINFGGKG